MIRVQETRKVIQISLDSYFLTLAPNKEVGKLNIHVFIDAENMPPRAALDAYDFLKSEHNVYKCDIIGKWNTLPFMYKNRRSKTFKIQNCDFGKNSADLWLTVSIAKAIYEEQNLELIAICSNDRDFAAVVNLAVEKGKQVLLLVMESQYTGIDDTLTKMGINRDFVTLGILKDEVPPFVSIEVDQLPIGLREYFNKFYIIKTIFVRRGEQFLELPFVDGMIWNMFVHMMRNYNIWDKKMKAAVSAKALKELGLKLVDNKVWYQSEEEMLK